MEFNVNKMDKAALQDYLKTLWCYQLKLENVNLEDDFLKLGAKSVDLFRMLTRIETDFNLEIDFDAFFEDSRLSVLLNILLDA